MILVGQVQSYRSKIACLHDCRIDCFRALSILFRGHQSVGFRVSDR